MITGPGTQAVPLAELAKPQIGVEVPGQRQRPGLGPQVAGHGRPDRDTGTGADGSDRRGEAWGQHRGDDEDGAEEQRRDEPALRRGCVQHGRSPTAHHGQLVGQGRIDPRVGDRPGHVHAPGRDLVERVVVRDDVELAALVEGLDARRHRFGVAEVGAAAVEHPDLEVLEVRLFDRDRLGGGVVTLVVAPAEEHVPGLARPDVDGELLERDVLAARAFHSPSVPTDDAAVVAVRVEGVVLRPDAQVAGDAGQRVCGLGLMVVPSARYLSLGWIAASAPYGWLGSQAAKLSAMLSGIPRPLISQ